jgi:hypothetical protein
MEQDLEECDATGDPMKKNVGKIITLHLHL